MGILNGEEAMKATAEISSILIHNNKNGDLIIVGSSLAISLGENTNAFLTKFNKNGEIIWTRPYGTPDGDDSWSYLKTKSVPDINRFDKIIQCNLFDVYLVGINSK